MTALFDDLELLLFEHCYLIYFSQNIRRLGDKSMIIILFKLKIDIYDVLSVFQRIYFIEQIFEIDLFIFVLLQRGVIPLYQLIQIFTAFFCFHCLKLCMHRFKKLQTFFKTILFFKQFFFRFFEFVHRIFILVNLKLKPFGKLAVFEFNIFLSALFLQKRFYLRF